MPTTSGLRAVQRLRMVELAQKGEYETALDIYNFDDLWTELVVAGYRLLKKVELKKLFEKSYNSNFTKLYLLTATKRYRKYFSGIFTQEKPEDEYMRERYAIMDTLYIDRYFPREYRRLMNHSEKKKAFITLENKVRNKFVYHYRYNGNKDKRKEKKYPFNDKKVLSKEDFTLTASFDFGNTNLRAFIFKQEIQVLSKDKLKITYYYYEYLYDYFHEPTGIKKFEPGHPYIIRTNPKRNKGTFIMNSKGQVVSILV